MAHRAARPVVVPNYCRLVGERQSASHGGIRQRTVGAPAQATFEVLAGVGHVPMIDDPRLVARTILAVTGEASLANLGC